MDNEEIKEPTEQKSSFGRWLENFWYHYKVHTIAVIFVLTVICIFTVQMCSRESYDIHIMYAGGKSLLHTQSEDNEYSQIVSSLGRVTEDYDENGVRSSGFLNLYIPSAAEMEVLEEEGRAEMLYSIIKSDTDTLNTNMMLNDYYICFFSEDLFRQYDKDQNDSPDIEVFPFADIENYIPDGSDNSFEYASERGIYLRSTEFYKMPGISKLPADTVVCIRIRSTVYSSKDNIADYKNSEAVMRNILSYKPV